MSEKFKSPYSYLPPVRISTADKDKLKVIADKDGTSVALLVRSILEKYIKAIEGKDRP